YRTFSVVPKATLTFDDKVLVFSGAKPRTVNLTVRNAVPAKGTVKLALPEGWKSTPAEALFDFATADGEQRVSFLVTPNSVSGTVSAVATFADGGTSTVSETTIDYPHIPIQTLFPPAEARLVRLAAETPKKRVGYVMGSGDEIPAALRQLGMEVTLLTDDDLAGSDLSRYDAIVAGIRAYNTRPRLKQLQPRLLSYVEKGGTLVVQYNTSGGDLVTKDLGPYPFELSRERVTVEEAPVTFLAKASPLLTTPNAISDKDFEGWVQERGLYFAGKWDPKYTAVLAASDPGEPAREGGLLYAKHGKGAFVFTGYSFFRQLPAGVPGAYRLFVNLVCAK
ncbi:MAG: LmbE family protein, partial [Acidobacteria bacterium]|nr:LmbE family protein [Acidobacteriota bacterium]